MKLFVKKAAPKKAAFTAINDAAKRVKGGAKKYHDRESTDID